MRAALEKVLAVGVYADGQPWRATRAWPAALDDPGRGLALELIGADGQVRGAVLDRGGVGLAADAALPELEGLIGEGWTVLAHRWGKRAVLRRSGDGVFRKLATRKATKRAVARAGAVEDLLAELPGVPGPPRRVGVDVDAGVIDLAPAPGVSLRDVLVASGTTLETAEAAGFGVGSVVARLGAVVPRSGELPEHTLADEAGIVERWVSAACALAPLSPAARRALRAEAETVSADLRAAEPRTVGLVHRDLHDGQVLVAADGGLTVLDWDTAAWAEPWVDPANLLAHLDLLVAQQPTSAERVAAATAGFRAALAVGEHPAAADPDRLALWRRASAVRIAAVHAFRRT